MRYLEDAEQKAFFEWCRLPSILKKYPQLEFIYSSQSGMKFNNAIAGARAKSLGMRKGVPDICLPVPRWRYCPNQCGAKRFIYAGLYIEMKRPAVKGASKGRASKEQNEMIDFLNAQGYKAVVCYGATQAIECVQEYLKDIE